MNGKKAKKLRKLAIEISQAVQKDIFLNKQSRQVLSAQPKKVYDEIKKMSKLFKSGV